MEVFECIKSRKSTKKFTGEMPPAADIEKIVEAAVYAPSGMNRQSWHFTVVTNKAWLDRLAVSVRENQGRAEGYCCHYGAPVLVIISADPSFHTSEADCACAAENMYLAATALGVGACWINQLGKGNCPPLRPLLNEAGVPETDTVYAAIALGYPPAGYDRPVKEIVPGVIKYFK